MIYLDANSYNLYVQAGQVCPWPVSDSPFAKEALPWAVAECAKIALTRQEPPPKEDA